MRHQYTVHILIRRDELNNNQKTNIVKDFVSSQANETSSMCLGVAREVSELYYTGEHHSSLALGSKSLTRVKLG